MTFKAFIEAEHPDGTTIKKFVAETNSLDGAWEKIRHLADDKNARAKIFGEVDTNGWSFNYSVT